VPWESLPGQRRNWPSLSCLRHSRVRSRTRSPLRTPSASSALSTPPDASAGQFIARKAAGNFIDIAGLTTLHLSPIWVLAIVSDIAYGSQTYLQELSQELQAQGLIDDASTIHKVDDLFDSIKRTCGQAASTFDQPPLSIEELRISLEQLQQSIREIDPSQMIPESEIRNYWTEMRTLATQEQVSLLGVSGAIAMQTVESIKGLTHGTMSGLFIAGQILNRNVFGHYAQALARIQERGLWSSVRSTYEPYVDLAWGNFTSSRKSWTEQVLAPGNMARAWNSVKGWWSKPEAEPKHPAAPVQDQT
jgi:hypothetical protein